MVKVDHKWAFRQIPVQRDHWLLGCLWQCFYYYHLRLPFGLRSAPALFNCIADAIEWILINNYGVSELLHYLDDFSTAAAAYEEAILALSIILAVLDRLGILWSLKKRLAQPRCSLSSESIWTRGVANFGCLSKSTSSCLRPSLLGCHGDGARNGNCSPSSVRSVSHARWYQLVGVFCGNSLTSQLPHPGYTITFRLSAEARADL
jgi:hypothetical protein